MAFRNRIRLPFMLSKAQFPTERNVFPKADGSVKVLSMVVRQTYEGQTNDIPEDWHRKIVIALAHDNVTVEDTRLLTDVVLGSDYSIDWKDFMNHPTAQAKFTVQVTPFNASNSNCQSCEEMSQVSLVDDTTDQVWQEGTTNDYPFSVLDNDSICCYPYTVEIVTFNTLYFDDVQVDQLGIITATVKDVVPTINNILLATYRVTCENGGYDEADVYINIEGTSTQCVPPSNLSVEFSDSDDSIAIFSWQGTDPAPDCGYDYAIYLASNLVVPLYSDTILDTTVQPGPLTPGESYVFIVKSNCCDGNLSTPTQLEFVQPSIPEDTCGSFRVTFTGSAQIINNYSYMDCSLVIQNGVHNPFGYIDLCMRKNPGDTVPIFFTANDPNVTVTYLGLC